MNWIVPVVAMTAIGLLLLHLAAQLALRATPYSPVKQPAPEPNWPSEQDDIGSRSRFARAVLDGLALVGGATIVLTLMAHPQWWTGPQPAGHRAHGNDLVLMVIIGLPLLLVYSNLLRQNLQLRRPAYCLLLLLDCSVLLAWAIWQGWLLVDLLAVLLVLLLLLALQPRLSFLRLSVSLALLAGLYDAVQVYGTGNMAHVAQQVSNLHSASGKSVRLPLLLIIPSGWSGGAPPTAELGVGDLVISGLLVIVAARAAQRSCQPALYWAALGGFVCGLLGAWLAVRLTDSGQPATIYLVPAIVLAVCLAAWRTGNWQQLKAKPYDYLPVPEKPRRRRRQSVS